MACIASKYTFNSQSNTFEKAQDVNEQYFEKGVISYIPRDSQLRPDELIGAKNGAWDDVESDLDESDEDEDNNADKQIFMKETRETMEKIIKNNFPKENALMEVKSLKMSYNMSYADCVEAVVGPILDIIKNS